MKLRSATFVLLSVALTISAAGETGKSSAEQRTFIACPIVRDTKTVPCWLAQYKGETYYLGIQSDQAAAFQPPQLEHQVLVEGSVAAGPRICGGVVLNPIKISVIPDIEPSCTTILPAVDEYSVPFATRGPGPNNPSYTGIPREAMPDPKPPYSVREFTVYFDFDAERAGRSTRVITEALSYAKAAHAKSVEITGYRAAVRLSDGTDVQEYPWIAEHRAHVMAETLHDLGIPVATIHAVWKTDAELGIGRDAPSKRRLTIVVTPE